MDVCFHEFVFCYTLQTLSKKMFCSFVAHMDERVTCLTDITVATRKIQIDTKRENVVWTKRERL